MNQHLLTVPVLPEIGLPQGHGVIQLGFDHSSMSIIALSRASTGTAPICRLSYRHFEESTYRTIGKFDENVSVQSFCINEETSRLYFTTFIMSDCGDCFGGVWESLYSFDLANRLFTKVAHNGQLLHPTQYRDCWLLEVLSFKPDTNTIYCTAGMENMMGVTTYFLSELSLASRRIIPLSELKSIFA